jgi:uncharacterized membrane protein (DUF4010 family)
MKSKWIKPFLTLLFLALLIWLVPSVPIDPWNLISPQKIITMIFALAFIQAFGSLMTHLLGTRVGALLTGFFGGLVSSTATTASLARKSKNKSSMETSSEMLTFLSATAAMLFEAIALIVTGTKEFHLSVLILFMGPMLATLFMIFYQSKKVKEVFVPSEDLNFEIAPILKLSLFIIFTLALSKVLQNIFGQNGLMILTFLVSLFEIHGSIIANVQLHESGSIVASLMGVILVISVMASYTSKLFLVLTLASPSLKKQVFKSTLILFASLAASWFLSSIV